MNSQLILILAMSLLTSSVYAATSPVLNSSAAPAFNTWLADDGSDKTPGSKRLHLADDGSDKTPLIKSIEHLELADDGSDKTPGSRHRHPLRLADDGSDKTRTRL